VQASLRGKKGERSLIGLAVDDDEEEMLKTHRCLQESFRVPHNTHSTVIYIF